MHILAILVLLASSARLFGATGPDGFHWSGHVTEGQLLEVRGVNGSIHAEPSTGDTVDVIAYRTGADHSLVMIGVKVEEHDGGVTISAPTSDAGARNDVNIDFTVRVPRGVHFVARTINGQVEARALQADTEAHTVNGDLLLSTAGTAQGETVNGTIVASIGSMARASKFSTVNGAITLAMPTCVRARVHAVTLNGRIRSEFPLAVSGASPARQATGSIGRGGPDLTIATVNGSIHLKQKKGV